MRSFLLLISLIALSLISCCQAEDHRFWTSESDYVDYIKSPESCSDVYYDYFQNIHEGEESEIRATIVSNTEDVQLYSLTESTLDYEWKWEISRLVGIGAPETFIYVGDTVSHTFTKPSSMGARLYETYLVTMYKDNYEGELFLVDQDYIYVLKEKVGEETPFVYNFDYDDIVDFDLIDDDGKMRVTDYPNFSSSASTRSDLGKLREMVSDKCLFPAYFSDSLAGANESPARLGDGCVHIFNPNKDENYILDSLLIDDSCQNYHNYFTYDFCTDPCGFQAFNILAEEHEESKNTLTAKSQLNFYPNHKVDDIYFYGFSAKIPENFEETRLINQANGAMGTDRWHIIAEFHQATWPYPREIFPDGCQAPFQLLYLGDDKIGIQYGLRNYNRCGFGPWEIQKGEWFDVVIHIKWSQVKEPGGAWTQDDGCIEFWLNTGDGYQKRCMVPATNFYRDHRDVGTKEANVAAFGKSQDFKTLLGPNLENYNPPYLSLKTMRGAAVGGTQGFDFRSDVFFDELRIGETIQSVLLQGEELLPDSLIDCEDIDYSKSMIQELDEDSWGVISYPNPSREGFVNLEFSGEWMPEGESEIQVYNMQGQMVFSGNLSEVNPSIRLETERWAKGVYIMKSFYGGQTKSDLIELVH